MTRQLRFIPIDWLSLAVREMEINSQLKLNDIVGIFSRGGVRTLNRSIATS